MEYALLALEALSALLMVAAAIGLWNARTRVLASVEAATSRADGARLGKAEIEIAELRELYEALLDSHKKLRSRLARRAENAERADAVPDWRADPNAARRALEAKHGIPSLG